MPETPKRAVRSDEAPEAIGPYSQAVGSGKLLFLSGQIGLNRQTGELVPGGTAAEAEQVLHNLGAVLKAAGLGLDDIVKTTIYLTDLSDFTIVNEVYGKCFSEPFPARATVGVAALPKGARVEIEAIAISEN